MSTARGAKLKAQYNRVRTSTSLRANDMWTNTIGLEQDPQAGSNSVIEAQIYAPTHGGGGKRTERRELAQQLIQASGYQPSVTDYQGLLTLAKAQGSLGVGARGACKLCGGLGHLTKQCTNYLTGHNASDGAAVVGLAGPAAAAGALPQGRGLLPDPSELSDISDLSSSSSDDSSASGSGSDSGPERKKRSKKRKRSSDKKLSSKKRSKSDKGSKKEAKADKKAKKSKSKAKRRKRKDASGSGSD